MPVNSTPENHAEIQSGEPQSKKRKSMGSTAEDEHPNKRVASDDRATSATTVKLPSAGGSHKPLLVAKSRKKSNTRIIRAQPSLHLGIISISSDGEEASTNSSRKGKEKPAASPVATSGKGKEKPAASPAATSGKAKEMPAVSSVVTTGKAKEEPAASSVATTGKTKEKPGANSAAVMAAPDRLVSGDNKDNLLKVIWGAKGLGDGPRSRRIAFKYWYDPKTPVNTVVEFPEALTVLTLQQHIIPALGIHYDVGQRLECWEPEEIRFIPVATSIFMPLARDIVLLKDADTKGSLEGLGEAISQIERRDEMYQCVRLRYIAEPVKKIKQAVNAAEEGVNDGKKPNHGPGAQQVRSASWLAVKTTAVKAQQAPGASQPGVQTTVIKADVDRKSDDNATPDAIVDHKPAVETTVTVAPEVATVFVASTSVNSSVDDSNAAGTPDVTAQPTLTVGQVVDKGKARATETKEESDKDVGRSQEENNWFDLLEPWPTGIECKADNSGRLPLAILFEQSQGETSEDPDWLPSSSAGSGGSGLSKEPTSSDDAEGSDDDEHNC